MAEVVGLTRQQIYEKAYSQAIEAYKAGSRRYEEYVNSVVNPKKTLLGVVSLPIKFIYELVNGAVQSAINAAFSIGVIANNLRNDIRRIGDASKNGQDPNAEINYAIGSFFMSVGEGVAQFGISTAGNLGRIVGIDPEWAFGKDGVAQQADDQFTQARGDMLGMKGQDLDSIRNAIDDRYYEDIRAELIGGSRFKEHFSSQAEKVLKTAYNSKTYGFKSEVSVELADKQFGNSELYQGLSSAVNSIGAILAARYMAKAGAKAGLSPQAVSAVSQSYFFANVFGDSYSRAVVNGSTLQDAYTYAIASAFIETAIENLGGNTPQKLANTSTFTKIMKNARDEGIEELAAEYGTTSFEMWSNPDRKIDAPAIGSGEFTKRALFAFLGGAFASAGLGAGNMMYLNGTVENAAERFGKTFDMSVEKNGEQATVARMHKELNSLVERLNDERTKGTKVNEKGGTFTGELTLDEKKSFLQNTRLDTYVHYNEQTQRFETTEAAKKIDKTMFDNYVMERSADGKLTRKAINKGEYAVNTSTRGVDISERGVRNVVKRSDLNKDGQRLLKIAEDMNVPVAVVDGDQATSGFYGKKSNILYFNQNAVSGMTNTQIRDTLARHEAVHKLSKKSPKEYQEIRQGVNDLVSVSFDAKSGLPVFNYTNKALGEYLKESGFEDQIRASLIDYLKQTNNDAKQTAELVDEEVVAYFMENVFEGGPFLRAISRTKSKLVDVLREKVFGSEMLKKIAGNDSRLYKKLNKLDKTFAAQIKKTAEIEMTLGYVVGDFLGKEFSLSKFFNPELVERFGLAKLFKAMEEAGENSSDIVIDGETFTLREYVNQEIIDEIEKPEISINRLSQKQIDEAVSKFVYDPSQKKHYMRLIKDYVTSLVETNNILEEKIKAAKSGEIAKKKRWIAEIKENRARYKAANNIEDLMDDILVRDQKNEEGEKKARIIISEELSKEDIDLLAEIIALTEEVYEDKRRENEFVETDEMRVIRNAVQMIVKHLNEDTQIRDHKNDVKWTNKARSADGGAVLVKEFDNPSESETEMAATLGYINAYLEIRYPNIFETAAGIVNNGKSAQYVVYPTDEFVERTLKEDAELQKEKLANAEAKERRSAERKGAELNKSMEEIVRGSIERISEVLVENGIDVTQLNVINPNSSQNDFLKMLESVGYTNVKPFENQADFYDFAGEITFFGRNHENYDENGIVMGIPSFDNVSEFVNRSLQVAPYVAVIVPITWHKSFENHKKVDENTTLIHSEPIGMQSFKMGAKYQPIKVALQIWAKDTSKLNTPFKNMRQFSERKDKHPDFETRSLVGIAERYQKMTDWKFDFAVRSQGNGADFNKVYHDISELKPTEKYILVRVSPDLMTQGEHQRVMENLEKIDFEYLAKVGQNLREGFNVADLVEAYEEVESSIGTVANTALRNTKVYDSEGNEFSAEQLDYLGKEAVRDKDGKVAVMYHSSNIIFDEFSSKALGSNTGFSGTELGFFVTPNRAFSERFKDIEESGKNGVTMKMYLKSKKSIVHPFGASSMYQGQELENIIKRYFEETMEKGANKEEFDNQRAELEAEEKGSTKGLSDVQVYAKYNGFSSLAEFYHQMTLEEGTFFNSEQDLKVLKSKGYDTIVVVEGIEKDLVKGKPDSNEPVISYIVFNANQLKSVDNVRPTIHPVTTKRMNMDDVYYMQEMKEYRERTKTNPQDTAEFFEKLNAEIRELNSKVEQEYRDRTKTTRQDIAKFFEKPNATIHQYDFLEYDEKALAIVGEYINEVKSSIRKAAEQLFVNNVGDENTFLFRVGVEESGSWHVGPMIPLSTFNETDGYKLYITTVHHLETSERINSGYEFVGKSKKHLAIEIPFEAKILMRKFRPISEYPYESETEFNLSPSAQQMMAYKEIIGFESKLNDQRNVVYDNNDVTGSASNYLLEIALKEQKIVKVIEKGLRKVGEYITGVKFETREIDDNKIESIRIETDNGVVEVWINSPYTPADNSITELYVNEKARKHGIGTALIEAVKLVTKGSISAQVSSVSSAMAFYKAGFRADVFLFNQEATREETQQVAQRRISTGSGSMYMEYGSRDITVKRVAKTYDLSAKDEKLVKGVLGEGNLEFAKDFFKLDSKGNLVLKNERVVNSNKVRDQVKVLTQSSGIKVYSSKDYAVHTAVDVVDTTINNFHGFHEYERPMLLSEMTPNERLFFDVLSTSDISFILYKSKKASDAIGYSISLPNPPFFGGNETPVVFIDMSYFHNGIEIQRMVEVAIHETFHEAFKTSPNMILYMAGNLADVLFEKDAQGKIVPTAVYSAFDNLYSGRNRYNNFLEYLKAGYGSVNKNFSKINTLEKLYQAMKQVSTNHTDQELNDYMNEVMAQMVGKLMSSKDVFEKTLHGSSSTFFSYYEIFEQIIHSGKTDATTRRLIEKAKTIYSDIMKKHMEILKKKFPSKEKYTLKELNDFLNEFTDGQFTTRGQLLNEYQKEQSNKKRGPATIAIDNIIYVSSLLSKTVQSAAALYKNIQEEFETFKRGMLLLIEHPDQALILYERRVFDFGTFKYKGTMFDLYQDMLSMHKTLHNEIVAGTAIVSIDFYEDLREMFSEFIDVYADINSDVITLFGMPKYNSMVNDVSSIIAELDRIIDIYTQDTANMTQPQMDAYFQLQTDIYIAHDLYNRGLVNNAAHYAMTNNLALLTTLMIDFKKKNDVLNEIKKDLSKGGNLNFKLLQVQKKARETMIKNLVLTIRTRVSNAVSRVAVNSRGGKSQSNRASQAPMNQDMLHVYELIEQLAKTIENNPFSAKVSVIGGTKTRIADQVVRIVDEIRQVVTLSKKLPDDVKDKVESDFVTIYSQFAALFEDRGILLTPFGKARPELQYVKLLFNEKTLASALSRIIIAFEKKYTSTFNDNMTLDEYAEMTNKQGVAILGSGEKFDGNFMGKLFKAVNPQDFFLAYIEVFGKGKNAKMSFFDDFFREYRKAAEMRGNLMMNFEKAYEQFLKSDTDYQKRSLERIDIAYNVAIQINEVAYSLLVKNINDEQEKLRNDKKANDPRLNELKRQLSVLYGEIQKRRNELAKLPQSDPQYRIIENMIKLLQAQVKPLLNERSMLRQQKRAASDKLKGFNKTKEIQDALIKYAASGKADQSMSRGEIISLYLSIAREIEMHKMVANGTGYNIQPTEHFSFGNQFHVFSDEDMRNKGYDYAKKNAKHFTLFAEDRQKVLDYLSTLLEAEDLEIIDFARARFDVNYVHANTIFSAKYQEDLPRQSTYIPFSTINGSYDRELELKVVNRSNVGAPNSLATATTLGATGALRIENIFGVVENATRMSANYSFERVISDWQNLLVNSSGGLTFGTGILSGSNSIFGVENNIADMIERMFMNVLQFSDLNESKVSKTFRKVLRNTVAATMALNIPSTIKQLASVSTIALKNNVNFGDMMKNVAIALATNNKYREWLMENNENFYHRAKSGNIPNLVDAIPASVLKGSEEAIIKLTRKLSASVGWFDNAVLVGAFMSICQEVERTATVPMTETEVFQKANELFKEVLLYGVANTDAAFRAHILNAREYAMKMLTKFQSENVLQVSALIRNRTMAKNGAKRAKYYGRRDFLAFLFSGLFTALVNGVFQIIRGNEERIDLFDLTVNEFLWGNIVGAIPIVNAFTNMIEFDKETGIRSTGFLPVIAGSKELETIASTLSTMYTGENIGRKVLRIIESAGMIIGAPIKNAVRMASTLSFILSKQGVDFFVESNNFFKSQKVQQGLSAAIKRGNEKEIAYYANEYFSNNSVKRELVNLLTNVPDASLSMRVDKNFRMKNKDGEYVDYKIKDSVYNRYNAQSQRALARLVTSGEYRNLVPKERLKAVQRVINYYYNFMKLKSVAYYASRGNNDMRKQLNANMEYLTKEPKYESDVVAQALRYAE